MGALPELGRMIDFGSFETFDPSGPGLGNLFGQISPFAALGIWPSGDFRVAPGDGAAPAVVFFLGAAFATVLLLVGVVRCLRSREHTILAGVATVAAVYLATRIGGTPYTAAKALEVAAPVLALAIVASGAEGGGWRVTRPIAEQSARRPRPIARAVAVYAIAAGACSLLALANAPVGPATYTPALTGLRPLLGDAPTLVLAPAELLDERHGDRYIAWELRGGRICIELESVAGAGAAPPGVRFVVTSSPAAEPPYPGFTLRRRAGPYAVWERPGVLGGPSPCPRVAVRQIRQGGRPR